MRFSERIGKRASKDIIQVDNMDDDLRNGLWNLVYGLLARYFSSYNNYTENNKLFNIIHFIWSDFSFGLIS